MARFSGVEKRRAPRAPLTTFCPAAFASGGQEHRAMMLDVSESGARFRLADSSDQCELEIGSSADDFSYQMEGWVPGQPHSLVLLDIQRHSRLGELFWIADPSNRLEVWSRENLVKLWHGQILRLVPREGPSIRRED